MLEALVLLSALAVQAPTPGAGASYTPEQLAKGAVAEIMSGRTPAASPAGQRGEYTPHPSTWFHQDRYFDDPAEWRDKRDVRQDDPSRVQPPSIIKPMRRAGQ